MKNFIKVLFFIALLFSFNNELCAQAENEDSVYIIIEESPKFIGGEKARIEFLVNNMTYPETARENGIQGTVYITFVIEIDGSVSNVKILRGIGSGCDEEVIRVIKLMPKWEPGKQRGKAVRVQFNMPVKFTLPMEDENEKK